MALKGKPVAIGNTATTIYTCPATKEAAVHGLLFGNNTASALAVDVVIYNQATGSDITVVTDLAVPANGIATWSKPINLNAGDAVKAVSSAASGMVCLYSTYEDGATPVASGFTARGVWDSASTYVANDIVSVSGSGTYVAIQGSTNQDPTTATAYWMFLEGISASALPAQSGNAGKYLTTDGSTASWGVVSVAGGVDEIAAGATNQTIASSANRVQVITATANINVTLPNTSSLDKGESFLIINKSAGAKLTLLNSNSEILTVVSGGTATKMIVVSNSTQDWEAVVDEIGGSLAMVAAGATGLYGGASSQGHIYAQGMFKYNNQDDTYMYHGESYRGIHGYSAGIIDINSETGLIQTTTNYRYDNNSDSCINSDAPKGVHQLSPTKTISFGYWGASPDHPACRIVDFSNLSSGGTHQAPYTPSTHQTSIGCVLEDNKAVLLACDYTDYTNVGGKYNGFIATVSGQTASFGAQSNMPSTGTYGLGANGTATALSSSSFVVSFGSPASSSANFRPYVCAATVSGTSITWGTPLQVANEYMPSSSVTHDSCKLDASTFLTAYRDPTTLKLKVTVYTVSGTSLTQQSQAIVGHISGNSAFRIERLSDTECIVYESDPSRVSTRWISLLTYNQSTHAVSIGAPTKVGDWQSQRDPEPGRTIVDDSGATILGTLVAGTSTYVWAAKKGAL